MSTAAATDPRNASVGSPLRGQVAEAAPPKSKLAPIQEVRGQIESLEPQFKMALPAHIPAERFCRVIMTAISANPDLINKCSRTSLFAAAMKSAQDGLLPDGREAALIPFNGVVQYLPMVAGILKKIRNSGQLSTIVARVVYAGDRFRNWIDDEGEHIEYEAADDQDRSVVRRVFAMAKLKDGSIEVEVLQPADIEKIRNVSRAKNNGPWVNWWDQMAQKSAIRRLSKRLPISTDLDDLIRRDDDLYDLKGARDEAVLANGGRPQSLAGRLEVLAQMPDRENAPEARRETDAGEGGADALAAESSDDRQGDPIGRQESGAEAGQSDTTAAERAKGAAVPQDKADPEKIAFLEKARLKAAQGTKKLRLFLGTISKAEEAFLTEADLRALEAIAEEADARAD